MEDFDYEYINPETGLPFTDWEIEQIQAILQQRDMHFPDADYADQLQNTRSRSDAQKEKAGEIIPPTFRPLAGLQANNRGNSQEVSARESPTTICDTTQHAGPDAETLVVTLGLELLNQSNENGLPATMALDVKALINWGIGGANYTALVDWEQGTAFTVCASFIRVSAIYKDTVPGLPDLLLSASFGYGFTGRKGIGAKFTQDLGILAAGATSGFVQIPQFATAFTIVSQDLVAAPLGFVSAPASMIVSSHNAGPGVGRQTAFQYVSGSNLADQLDDQYSLFNSARWIEVRNDGPNPARMMLVYSIAL
jgi:hypothetical protein